MASNREADFTTSVSRKISTQSTHGKATMHSQKLEVAVGGGRPFPKMAPKFKKINSTCKIMHSGSISSSFDRHTNVTIL